MKHLTNDARSLELKKHVNAIHCTNNLSLVQRKLFNALLFNAYSELPYKAQFEIPARTLCNLIGYNSNDYAKLKKALLALITIAIEWNVIDYSSKGAINWRASSVLSAATLENGLCTYEYSSIMRELLYHPEIYGRINMAILTQFNSNYGLALYENCIRYQGLPQTPWFTIEIFRKLMGVFNDKYTAFKDFKKRVLDVAVAEVNQHSPIHIIPEIKRQNQKVANIRFKLVAPQLKAKNEPDIDHNTHEEDMINCLSKDFGFSPEVINNMRTQYETSYLREKVNLIINSESYRMGKIRGPAGYLMDALKKDYKSLKSSKLVMAEKREEKISQEAAIAQYLEKQKQRYEECINSSIENYVLALSEDANRNLLSLFELDLKNSNNIVYGWFLKYGLEHSAVKALYRSFIKKEYSLALKLISFEDFIVAG
ncbi:replication initiation protein [soil metagenome]